MDSQQPLGYSTKSALVQLRDGIRNVIEEHKQNNPTGYGLVRNIISFSSEKVLLSGVAYTITFLYIICLILTYLLGDYVKADGYLLWLAFFLFVILIINFLIALNEEYLFRHEIPHRVKKVLGMLVNLPWALLVEGDVIVLRPGQEVPGHCRGLQPHNSELFFGQTFQPKDASDPLIQALSESNLKPDSLKSLWKTFFNILLGREDMVVRTANIVHVLGSLSALCCVDKKGILSWPNPTAEKVFFLRNSGPASGASSKTSLVGSMRQSQTNLDQEVAQIEPSTIVENAPFCVEFDDQRWRQHLARLKPLGLAAVLNTCAPAPRHTYAHFCAHLTCEAQYRYGHCGHYGHWAGPQADTIRRETRFVRSLHLSTRVKVPLPHMLAVVVKDQANQLQMLTQGTADIILDSCVDYWNGRDLTPISPADRKKIIDFYQRNSLTAYCTAFAYK
ncbi:hypothetical protein MSG28_003928 [Choristoneura fumiferana]|uniref:Uncharacterized protein n=1 Tax=Choristoneura fumiferana TaxID=7141 RepID=A0ACC0KHE2_CHOFU|nr:hypothetical protein MSG28_003928 [Choristoneura fumiferana]